MSAPPIDVLCMAAPSSACAFEPMRFKRRALEAHDILIDMRYCGICHTDLHNAAGHMARVTNATWPMVPGHELAGVVAEVGAAVASFKVGDHVGVGCIIDSCLECAACRRGEEQMCAGKMTSTYNGAPKHGRAGTVPPGSPTLGGYTDRFVVHERFAVRIPPAYPLECAGPVMCAGVTVFDPLRRYGAGLGTRVAVVGLGGLGVLGLKIARAMGCDVTAVSRGRGKSALAAQAGAGRFVDSTSAAELAAARGSCDLVLNTIPAEHDVSVYTALLAPGKGTHVLLGINSAIAACTVAGALLPGARVKASAIGSIEATQAVIDLCAAHDIRPEIRVIPVEGINGAYEALDRCNDAGLRYVIDIKGTLNDGAFERCKGVAAPSLSPAQPLTIGKILWTLAGLVLLRRAW